MMSPILALSIALLLSTSISCLPTPDQGQRQDKAYYDEQRSDGRQTLSAGEHHINTQALQHATAFLASFQPPTHAGLIGGKVGNQVINADGRIFGYHVYQRQPGTGGEKDGTTAAPAYELNESGGHATAIESSVGMIGDNIKLGGKYLTGGVECESLPFLHSFPATLCHFH